MHSVLDTLRASEEERLAQLEASLRHPSISCQPEHQADMAASAAWFASALAKAGMDQVTVHATPGHPIVTGAWRHAPGCPTLLIYGHYDVQPVDPIDLWSDPPFTPRIRNGRIYARGSADDKGQVLMHIQAAEAIMKRHGRLPVNLVFLIEGEEEISSPNLPHFLETHRELLAADFAVVSDTCMWEEGVPAITGSLRGLVALEVEVTGPKRDLHSGSFGGVVANPVEILARMIATLKDDQGTIRVPGFYDSVEPLTPAERAAIAEAPFDLAEYHASIGIAADWGEAGFSPLERLWRRPTIEINGLWGGYAGPGVKTVLPSKAYAKLSMRLVSGQTPDGVAGLVARHLESVAPPGVKVVIHRLPGGGMPWKLDPELPAVKAARQSLAEAFGREPLLIGEGASIPIVADFDSILRLKTLLIGFSLPDAAPHSPDENLHLPSFHTGIESLVRFFYRLGSTV
nr:Peptidase M20 [uncultured bacterium]